MQKETLWPLQVCATKRKCLTLGEESETWEANKECLFVHGINFDTSVMVRPRVTPSVTDRVHVRWKSFFFFFLHGHIFFWPESLRIYFFINNFLGKFSFLKFLLPHYPGPIIFLMVHPLKRRLRANLYLHLRPILHQQHCQILPNLICMVRNTNMT